MAVTPPPKREEEDPFTKPGADEFIKEGASYKKGKNQSNEDEDLKAKTIPSTMISLRVPDHMLKKINKLWKEEGGTVSRNSWLLQIIQDYLKSDDN